MDEKEEEKQTNENSNEGFQQETTSELDRADQIAERQKRENEKREKLLEREEALHARKMVGGETEAGKESKPEVEKEESDSEYRQRIEREMREGKYNDRDEE